MKTHCQPVSRAFTLLEILVVITIVAILGSVVAGQIIRSIDDANRLKTWVLVEALRNGTDSYHANYNRFALEAGAAGANGEDVPEMLTDGSNSLVDALMGIPPPAGGRDFNPKRISFASFSPAKGDSHGLVGDARPSRLHDMWGQPLRILLDTNSDNQVTNPDAASADPKVSQGKAAHLVTTVAVYSCGKDKKPNTADDIVSWRSK